MKVIYALWLRQVKRYFRSKSRIVGALGQPLLYLVALGFGLGPVFESAGQGSYINFLVPGVIAMSTLFTSLFSGIQVIWDKQFGFLKETLVAPVSRLKIFTGMVLGGATTAIIQGFVIFVISFAVGFRVVHWSLVPLALLFMVLISIIFTALGTAIASRMEDFHGFQLVMNFMILPLFFLSGALFPLNNLPPFLDVVTKFNPLAYGVDGMRGAILGTTYFGFAIDSAVLVVLAVILFVVGSYFFSKIQI